MADKGIIRHNGERANLPARRDEGAGYPSMYREMSDWMSQWDRYFDNVFRSFGFPRTTSLAGRWGGESTFTPAINIAENDHEYRVTAELPGMDEKDIDITLSKDTLTIRGEKREETDDKGKGYHRTERSYGTFFRTFQLPEEIDPDKVDATFDKGVLAITLPKKPETETGTRKIQVKPATK